MIPLLATIASLGGICVLFWLDRDDAPLSKAAWLPFTWLLIASSRPISSWVTFSVPDASVDQYIDGSPLDRNVLTLLLVLALFALSKRAPQVRAILSLNAALVIYFIYCGISLLWADYPFVVFKRWIRSAGDVAMILIIITEPDSLEVLKRVFTRIAFLIIPLSILFIRFYPSLGRIYSIGGVPEWTGVGTDKNALGMICMLYGTTLVWSGLSTFRDRSDKYRRRKLTTTAILLILIVYLVSVVNSQTALACFIMASLLVVLTEVGPVFRKPVLLTSLLAGMLTVSFCVLFMGVSGGVLSLLGRDASLTGRTEVWKTLLPYATNAWVGTGYENFWIGDRYHLIVEVLGRLNQAHNGYIEIYLNIGWVGVFLLSAVVFMGYGSIFGRLNSDPEAARLKMAFFLICVVYNFTEASFKMGCPVWIAFLWAIIATPKHHTAHVPSTNISRDDSEVTVSASNGWWACA
jgi:O-antigen ligase